MADNYVAIGTAVVWHFNGRRYLTKRAAYQQKAKQWMQRDHSEEQPFSDEWSDCNCLWCRDKYERGGKLHKRLTRYLMRRSDAI